MNLIDEEAVSNDPSDLVEISSDSARDRFRFYGQYATPSQASSGNAAGKNYC